MQTIQFIRKRDNRTVPFERARILTAIQKGFLSENLINDPHCEFLTSAVLAKLISKDPQQITFSVESIQDTVEQVLIENGHHRVARNYISYRDKHKTLRQEKILNQIVFLSDLSSLSLNFAW